LFSYISSSSEANKRGKKRKREEKKERKKKHKKHKKSDYIDRRGYTDALVNEIKYTTSPSFGPSLLIIFFTFLKL